MPINFTSLIALNFSLCVAFLMIQYILFLSPLTHLLAAPVRFRVRGYGVRLIEMGQSVIFRRIFQINYSGKVFDENENAIIFANHSSIFDYLLLTFISDKVSIFFFIHGQCTRFPNLKIIYNAYQGRSNWVVPHKNLDKIFAEYKCASGPKWVVVLPEVSMYCDELARSHQVACTLSGAPTLNHLLYPRFPSVIQGIDYLRSRVTSIYDLTIHYTTRDKLCAPSITALAADQHEWTAHVDVTQVPITSVPRTVKKLEKFIEKGWYRKDHALNKLKKQRT